VSTTGVKPPESGQTGIRSASSRLKKRLKLVGDYGFKGTGVFAPWRTRTFVPPPRAGGRLARSLSAIR
jgi:hypothetical protein